MTKKVESSEEENSLASYLKDNDRLLTALGVFAALLVIFEGFESPFFKVALSFLSMMGMILIWAELRSKMPRSASLYLILFQYVLSWGEIGLVGYVIYKFRTISNLLLPFPSFLLIFWFIAATFIPIIRRFEFTRKLFGIDREKKTFSNHVVRIVCISTAVVLAIIGGVSSAFGVNIIFEALKRVNF